MKLHIVDVFAEKQLAGNQLAVIECGTSLTDKQMQDIAREMNFSETTFVLDASSTRAKVRIFTPEWELPFAGHPTLGTAWVLGRENARYELDLPAGIVPVAFEDDICWMTPPPVDMGASFDIGDAAALIGLSADDLDIQYPVQLAEVGPKFLLVALKNRDALARVQIDVPLFLEHQTNGVPMQCIFLFTEDSHAADAQYAARMFYHSGSMREDPATGSANTAFAAYLREHKGGGFEAIVDQGVEMKRPSRLYLRVGDQLQVGGKVQPVVEGEINL